MHFFYTPDINSDVYTLNEQESRHCVKVLRLKTGDIIYLTDGIGNIFKTEIIDTDAKACKVNIIETFKEYEKRNFKIHIAVAPTKNINRLEWFLEKATEIGIDEITPIICEHSERKILKTERLNKIIISAIKQSLKAYKPILNEAISLNDFLNKDFQEQKFIAYCDIEKPRLLQQEYTKGNDVLILIGPEGDFSKEEFNYVLEKGFSPVSLGNSRLRTETAALVACNTINIINNI